jgi:hypothetical protein
VTELEQGLNTVRERIVAAAERARRNPDTAIIVAVTKAVAPERVEEAVCIASVSFLVFLQRFPEILPTTPWISRDRNLVAPMLQ